MDGGSADSYVIVADPEQLLHGVERHSRDWCRHGMATRRRERKARNLYQIILAIRSKGESRSRQSSRLRPGGVVEDAL